MTVQDIELLEKDKEKTTARPAGEMARQLRVLVILEEDLGLIPSNHVELIAVCNSSTRGSKRHVYGVYTYLQAKLSSTQKKI